MRCAACDTANPPDAKFCTGCGAGLARPCPGCGHLNPAAGRFCSECGAPLSASPVPAPKYQLPRSYTPRELQEKILANRAAIEGERKQITAMSADIAGFTPLAERMDAEEIHELATRCFDTMLVEVHRYEGHVAQFTGDGMLALFGAPIAHEDHAQRAVRAGLGIQQALVSYQQDLRASRGIDLRVRLGFNSGTVVVGTIGTDMNITYTASGDSVNLAQRVQSLAQPGSVAISHHTERLIRGYFETLDLGERAVKGKQEPVRIYQVLRPNRWRSRVDVYSERGLSPLVGRRSELAALLDRFAAVQAGGQAVFVRGEAGIGKSRLLHEARRRLEGEDLGWVEGRCISYGYGFPYYPIIDLLRDFFAIEESDPEPEILRKLANRAPELGLHLPYLRHLLAVDPGDPAVVGLDATIRKAATFDAVRALLGQAARVHPLVLVLEDLHWIDPVSEELISFLIDALPEHRILLIGTHRPGFEPRFGVRAYVARVDLERLSEWESAAIARATIGAEVLPLELRELIHRKAEGNPFFVEEITRSLLEDGTLERQNGGYVLSRRIEDVHVPDKIQDVIMARIDRLPEEPKRAIQTASVIGREFAVRLLERTAELRGQLDVYLQDLKSIELIYERGLYPELAYMFKHALTHDVAYGSLLQVRRRQLHRLVAAAIEELYRDRPAEHYEALAHHYEQAEAWEKALEYLCLSAQKSLAAAAGQTALGYYDRALALLERRTFPDEQVLAVHLGRGQALMFANQWDRAAGSFERMLGIAREAGDRLQEGVALCQIGGAMMWAHRFDESLDFTERARRLALETDNPAVLAGSQAIASFVLICIGELTRAASVSADAIRVGRQCGANEAVTLALNVAGILAHWRGDAGQALPLFEEAKTLARKNTPAFLLLFSLGHAGFAYCAAGDYPAALAHFQEQLDRAISYGDRVCRARALNSLGWVHLDLCSWDRAVELNRRGAEEGRAIGEAMCARYSELNLADCYLSIGRLDDARHLLERLHEECSQRGGWGEEWVKWRYTQYLRALLAELALKRGDAPTALAEADTCLAAAEATGSRRNVVKARRLRGAAFLSLGQLAGAEAELVEALRVAREVGNPPQLWKTLAALADLRDAQGRSADARAARVEAIAIVERVADDLVDAEIRATLLAAPPVAALRAAIVD